MKILPRYDDIVHDVNNILRQYEVKLTLRQVYYRLVAAGAIENNMNSYKTLSKWLVKARERGEVDDSRFEDRARYTQGGDNGWDSPEEYVDALKRSLVDSYKRYSRRMWEGQDNYVECWIEKDALSRLVGDIADRYNVITCVARGYSSYTFLNDAAARISEFVELGRTPVILYFGDFDPSGEDMVRDLGVRLERYGLDEAAESIIKVALTPDQIRQYNLPPAPVKLSDSRAAGFIAEHGEGVVELDALEPPVLQEMVRRAIQRRIDADMWNRTAQLVETEKTSMIDRLARIGNAIREL